jgi:ribosomal RNA-processing protein 36
MERRRAGLKRPRRAELKEAAEEDCGQMQRRAHPQGGLHRNAAASSESDEEREEWSESESEQAAAVPLRGGVAAAMASMAAVQRARSSGGQHGSLTAADSASGGSDLEGDSGASEEDEEDESGSGSGSGGSVDAEQDTVEQLRATLRELPLAQLAKLKKSGVNGVPLHRALELSGPEQVQAWLDGSLDLGAGAGAGATKGAAKGGRGNEVAKFVAPVKAVKKKKSAPVEMTSKKQVSRLRTVVKAPVRVVRDPRFEVLSAGPLVAAAFDKRYGFLKDKREDELAELKDSLRRDAALRAKTARQRSGAKQRVMDDTERAEAQATLTRMQQERAKEERLRSERELTQEVRKKERELVAKGKQPFFLHKSELKKLELAKRFDKLDEAGQLDRFMEKRRKKNSQKERRMLPGRKPKGGAGARGAGPRLGH